MKTISAKHCFLPLYATIRWHLNGFTKHIFPISESFAISFGISWLWLVHTMKTFSPRIDLSKVFLFLPLANNSYSYATETKVKYTQYTTFGQRNMFNNLLTASGKTKPWILTSHFFVSFCNLQSQLILCPEIFVPYILKFPSFTWNNKRKNKQSYLQGKQRLL